MAAGAATAPAPAPRKEAATAKAAPRAEAARTESRREEPVPAKLSPSVRRLVEENKLDPAQIAGSGRDGRITKSDIVDYLGQKPAAPEARRPAGEPATARPAAPGARADRRVPMTRLRSRIAERMVQAQSTQALLTSFNEIDLKAVQDLRARHKERFEKEHGVRLGLTS